MIHRILLIASSLLLNPVFASEFSVEPRTKLVLVEKLVCNCGSDPSEYGLVNGEYYSKYVLDIRDAIEGMREETYSEGEIIISVVFYADREAEYDIQYKGDFSVQFRVKLDNYMRHRKTHDAASKTTEIKVRMVVYGGLPKT